MTNLWIKIESPRQMKVTMEANTFKCPHCPCYEEGEECCGCGERKEAAQMLEERLNG